MRPALPFADRRDQVDDAAGDLAGIVVELEPELRVGKERREVFEADAAARLLGRHAVDEVDTDERRILLAARGRTNGTLHVVAFAQSEATNLRSRHVRVVAAGEVAARAQEAVALVAKVEQTFELDQLAGEVIARLTRFARFRALAAHTRRSSTRAGTGTGRAITIAAPSSPAATIALAVVVAGAGGLMLRRRLPAVIVGLVVAVGGFVTSPAEPRVRRSGSRATRCSARLVAAVARGRRGPPPDHRHVVLRLARRGQGVLLLGERGEIVSAGHGRTDAARPRAPPPCRPTRSPSARPTRLWTTSTRVRRSSRR